jgi:pyruvate, orthophosphate dikinase
VDDQIKEALTRLEQLQGQKLGAGTNPLLVSVRSGAKFSMPGMMDTVLNLGLNDQSTDALAKRTNNARFAYDAYRRLIQMFGNVVLEIPKSAFDEVFEAKKKQRTVKLDTDLDAKALKEVIEAYKRIVAKHTKHDFPEDPHQQLVMARDAVFRSWNNDRAKHYRRINSISDDLGTAVNVQAMVFGNLGEMSGTGVGFTRNPAIGNREFYGEFLMNAQGEDVVAGIRNTPVHISERKDHARSLLAVAGNYHTAGKALPRHAGFRVHDPGRQTLHAADAPRQAHWPRGCPHWPSRWSKKT